MSRKQSQFVSSLNYRSDKQNILDPEHNRNVLVSSLINRSDKRTSDDTLRPLPLQLLNVCGIHLVWLILPDIRAQRLEFNPYLRQSSRSSRAGLQVQSFIVKCLTDFTRKEKHILKENYAHIVWVTTTNVYVRKNVNSYLGHQKLLLSVVKRRKFPWFGHAMTPSP